MELTDAVIFHGDDGTIAVLRGGSCTFPLFWNSATTAVHISTLLPLRSGAAYSKAGLVAYMTAVCMNGKNEPNAWNETPLHVWRRVRCGFITTFRLDGRIIEDFFAAQSIMSDIQVDEEVIAENIRRAFEEFSNSQRHVASSVLELSGGFDSTLAGAFARSANNSMVGVSFEYPHYEFRFEEAVQSAVGSALGVSRTVLDGTEDFPFSSPLHRPRLDEPTPFIGIRRAERVGIFAASHKASKIYVGHGGDHLFCADLDGLQEIRSQPDRSLFTKDAWHTVKCSMEKMLQPLWCRLCTGCLVYDVRQDVWAKERFGAIVRTPYTDLALFRAAQMWSRWNSSRGVQPDKSILIKAFPDILPEAVKQRRGKVPHDGIWMQAHAKLGDHIAGTIDQTSAVLEHIGISPKWLLRRVRHLEKWEPVSSEEVTAAFAIADWLICWGIESVSDVSWV